MMRVCMINNKTIKFDIIANKSTIHQRQTNEDANKHWAPLNSLYKDKLYLFRKKVIMLFVILVHTYVHIYWRSRFNLNIFTAITDFCFYIILI